LARKGYAHIKATASASREEFLESLAALQSSMGNETISSAIRRIKRLEKIRSANRRIRMVTKEYTGATERIMVEEGGENRITTDKLEIEVALKNENEQKFRLAYQECPFLQQPLLHQLGQHATKAIAQKILNGSFTPPRNTSKYTKRFIKLLQMPEAIKKMEKMMIPLQMIKLDHTGRKNQKEYLVQCPVNTLVHTKHVLKTFVYLVYKLQLLTWHIGYQYP